ncbi:unnamed protein product, partial [Scytosiphon promiscuus]
GGDSRGVRGGRREDGLGSAEVVEGDVDESSRAAAGPGGGDAPQLGAGFEEGGDVDSECPGRPSGGSEVLRSAGPPPAVAVGSVQPAVVSMSEGCGSSGSGGSSGSSAIVPETEGGPADCNRIHTGGGGRDRGSGLERRAVVRGSGDGMDISSSWSPSSSSPPSPLFPVAKRHRSLHEGGTAGGGLCGGGRGGGGGGAGVCGVGGGGRREAHQQVVLLEQNQ